MDKRIKDLTGMRFNKLIVLRFAHTKNKKSYWVVKCDCGTEKIMRSDVIQNPLVISCGCYNSTKEHGKKSITHGKSGTKLYRVWASMIQRCENKNSNKFKDYGARGIKVFPEWHDFDIFYTFATSNGYAEDLEIDRIDNNGNYEPNNCRFTTRKQQCLNQRRNHMITWNGTTLTISQWAETFNIPYMTLYNPLYKHNFKNVEVIFKKFSK